MKVIDTFPEFPVQRTIHHLREYYQKYEDIFDTYFSRHCKNTDERLGKAIERYSTDWASIEKVHQAMPYILDQVVDAYHVKYQLEFPISVNLIVGAYGSNAYTHRQIIPDITFALERITDEEDPLRVIVAHEFGHASHNMISDKHQTDWKNMQWEHPYVWLLQEGAATHFSKQVVPNLKESIYFSYDSYGDEWLDFANSHKEEIISQFLADLQSEKSSQFIFKEWFSINGGDKFGYTRLAYSIADWLFQDLVKQRGELGTLLLWKEADFLETIENALERLA